LNQAKVYISVMPEEKIKEVIEILNKNIYEIQHKLNKRLNMKILPRLIFIQEKETVTAGKVEEILEKLISEWVFGK